ncbi:hypothetical protein ON006_05265 [Dyadobacter pollutisoli]|uniref:Uncharacterized protein n=1 Tax=Dyadobacter pollutisoli TaxID=2910158 RepID=A0A9E8SQS3_9BACT|nr:hypothetical protein ON006_05265 [Dyadobacter pollutisoli]
MKFTGQSEPVKQAKDQNGSFCVGLKAENLLEATQIVKAFVDNREGNDRID